MTCAEMEILLADYVDGTLHREQKSALEDHLGGCASCAELARDAAGAVGFMERAPGVEAPPELVTRILFEITSGPSRAVVKPHWSRRLFGKWLEPVLQPRFAMGMAMTLLSFAMLGRFSGIKVRQLTPSDLDPVKVWMAAEDRVHRTWERGVKYYESLRMVFEIQTRLREWAEESSAQPAPETKIDTEKK
jgi:anti-sigma factor RsiW